MSTPRAVWRARLVTVDEEPAAPEIALEEPESVKSCRAVLERVRAQIDAGSVDSLYVCVHHPDGCYMIFNSTSNSRHESAGVLLEMAIKRLGFADADEPPED